MFRSVIRVVLFVVLVAVLASSLVGCGGTGDVVSSIVSSGEQGIVDGAAAEKGYPEYVLPGGSKSDVCPTGYVKVVSGNTVLCHNPAGAGNNPAK
jgi:hypothetical protein